MTAIQFASFTFTYAEASKPALRDVDLSVGEGEIVLVVGRSGCGKSTLATAVNGIVPQLIEGKTEGSVTVFDKNTAEYPVSAMADEVGLVFQDPEVQLFALTVEDEISMALESYGVPREEMQQRVSAAMATCGLEGLELAAPARLSGGQKQRVAIASVLARNPRVLVFDEATGNLDPAGARSVYEAIRRVCLDEARTVVLIEQDLDAVIDIVDRIVVLEEGSVAYDGPVDQALRDRRLLNESGIKVPAATRLALQLESEGLVTYPQLPTAAADVVEPLLGRASGRPADVTPEPPQTPEPARARDVRPAVEFRNVTHVYSTGHRGLDDISFRIDPGEFVAVCGMNGAGKSTAAFHVMGLLRPTEGHVLVEGAPTDKRTVAEMARIVGLIFQNPNHQLFKDTVEKELSFGPNNLGWEPERTREAMKEALDMVGLTGLEQRDPEQLSIGQKQLVAIASVLIMQPRILILDEPTTGQDQRSLRPFMQLVRELNGAGMTILMITHDMEVVLEYANRVIVMRQGSVLADGTPSEVFPRTDVLREASLAPPDVVRLAWEVAGDRNAFAHDLGELAALVARQIGASQTTGTS